MKNVTIKFLILNLSCHLFNVLLITTSYRSSRQDVFRKIGVLRNSGVIRDSGTDALL